MQWLSSRRARVRAYFVLLATFYALALALVALKDDFDFAVSDGRYYYAYLPSVVIDGDLDFENQIREHWGPDFDPLLLQDRTERGYVQNKYSVGLALTLAPSFLAAHAGSHILDAVFDSERFRPDGYSTLYQLFNLALVLLLGLATFVLIDKLLVDHFAIEPTWVFASIVLYWTGSHYAYYYFREPLMVHVASTFWVTACLYLAKTRSFDGPGSARAAASIALTAAMAIVARPTNAVVLLPFLAPFIVHRGFVRALPFLLLGALPIALQLAAWRTLHGEWVHYSYRSEGFNWLSPKLLSTLFSSRHGLLFWAPLLIFPFVGVVLGMRSELQPGPRRTCLQLCSSFLLLWYFNSCWHQWWFGDAFGGRAFLELSLLFTLGLAWFLRASSGWSVRFRRLCYVLVSLCYVVTYALMALYVTHRIPRGDYLF